MDNINVSKFNYDSIKYFLSVAKHGSISRAANSLGISQSALSQSMKNLEQSLGIALFVRNTRGIILTEEGKVLYARAAVGNEQFERAIVETLRCSTFKTSAPFKIAIPSSLVSSIISPNIRDIQKKFPDTNFEFCHFVIETEVVEDLQRGKYDVAIFKTNADFIVKEVEMEKLCERTYVFTYNPKFFQPKDNLTLTELGKFPIIMKDRSGRNDNSWIKFSFDKFICCRNDNQCLEMIKNGAGIGLYPKEFAAREGLSVLKVEGFKPTKRIVNMCYLSSNKQAKEFAKALLTYKIV